MCRWGEDGRIAGPSLEDQLERVFLNLKRTLRAADADFSNVARMTIYIRNLSSTDLAIIRTVRDRHIDHRRPPASALIGVAELYDPGVRVEIDAIAAIA
ncbi:RidA family protein [Aquamicrobium terrae]